MKTETREIHFCDFCNKLYLRKKMAEKHELVCNKNSINDRPCFHCPFLTKKGYQQEEYFGDQSYLRKLDLLFCEHFEHYLYPPSAERKKNWIETGESESMPKECSVNPDDYI